MAQIIKHRRGSLESLSTVTGSLQKGEIVIASGSSNLTTTNGSGIAFIVPADGQVQAINRFLMGDAAPNTFAAGTYNGMMKGVPYYASGSSTLYLLGSGGNDAINLEGNIQPFSASVATAINALSASIGGGSIGTAVAALNTFSASAKTSIESLNSFSSSQLSKDSTLATYTGSVETRLTEIGVVSGSLILSASAAKTTNDSQGVSITNLNSFTQSFSQSVATNFSASNASITSLSASVASVTGDFSSSVATSFSASAASQSQLSASVATSFSASSANVSASQATQNGRLDAIEALDLTLATTGSNIFKGNQVITGSMYITNDLIVYGSSSLFNVTASALDIGQNTIVLNTATPAVRFGGISVADSGSGAGASGSLFWDSLNNAWIYQHPTGAETYASAKLISGPQNSGSLGDEAGLTVGKITLAVGDDHIGDSIITQTSDNSKISIGGGLDVTGNVVVTGSLTVGTSQVALLGGNNLVTSSAQILFTGIDGYDTYSSSVSASLAQITSNVGAGVGVSITNLNSFTQSFSSSYFDASASFDTRISNVSSSVYDLSGSVYSVSSSLDTRVFDVSSSVYNLSGSAYSVSSSLDTRVSNVSSSVNTLSSSVYSVSSSLDTRVSDVSSSVNTLSGSTYSVSSSLDTRVSNVSASVYDLSGSTFVVSSSLDTRISNVSSSLSTLSGSTYSVSSSIDTRITNLSSSVATSFSASNAADAGLGNRISTLEGTGTIQGLGTSNNVTFAKVTTTGDVVVGGDLVVQGNTVTLNTSQLVVEDKLITLASGSTSNATADGAGFEVAGTTASFKYDGINNQFSSSIDIVSNLTGSVNLGSAAGSSKRIAFRNTNGNLDLVPTASVAGDLLQWNGSDFVMSNTIDGGSF